MPWPSSQNRQPKRKDEATGANVVGIVRCTTDCDSSRNESATCAPCRKAPATSVVNSLPDLGRHRRQPLLGRKGIPLSAQKRTSSPNNS